MSSPGDDEHQRQTSDDYAVVNGYFPSESLPIWVVKAEVTPSKSGEDEWHAKS